MSICHDKKEKNIKEDDKGIKVLDEYEIETMQELEKEIKQFCKDTKINCDFSRFHSEYMGYYLSGVKFEKLPSASFTSSEFRGKVSLPHMVWAIF